MPLKGIPLRLGIFILFQLFNFNKIESQNAYLLNGKNGDVGDAHIQWLDNENYWTIQALPSGAAVTGYPVIRITEFNKCGPTRTTEFTNLDIYGISSFRTSFADGDTVRIIMRISPKNLYPSDEVGILSIDKKTFKHRYNYVRADNSIIPITLIPVKNNQYFLYAFLSYTDRPPRYGSFLLNNNFDIIDYYENFIEWTVAGDVVELEDGYILATSENIYKLNKDLSPLWLKKFEERRYTGGFIKQSDGIVMYAVQPPFPWETVLIKIDFEGNLMWQSNDVNFNDMKFRNFQVFEKSNGDLEFYVFKSDPDALLTDQLAIYTIDSENGNIISAKNTFNHPLIEKFRLTHFSKNNTDINQLLLKTPDNKHLIWNIVDGASCDLNDGAPVTQASTPIQLTPANTPITVQDYLKTGSYIWTSSDTVPDAELICETILPFNDQLQDYTSACKEIGLSLDISEVPYPIIWENGDTLKTKTISNTGTYSYIIDYCDIDFEETIHVELETCDCEYFIPNAFSPNDDGFNDAFKLFNPCEYLTAFEFKIFNRWGDLVFSTEDQLAEWDGTYLGQNASPGVYAYFIKYESSFGSSPRTLEGSVLLVR